MTCVTTGPTVERSVVAWFPPVGNVDLHVARRMKTLPRKVMFRRTSRLKRLEAGDERGRASASTATRAGRTGDRRAAATPARAPELPPLPGIRRSALTRKRLRALWLSRP